MLPVFCTLMHNIVMWLHWKGWSPSWFHQWMFVEISYMSTGVNKSHRWSINQIKNTKISFNCITRCIQNFILWVRVINRLIAHLPGHVQPCTVVTKNWCPVFFLYVVMINCLIALLLDHEQPCMIVTTMRIYIFLCVTPKTRHFKKKIINNNNHLKKMCCVCEDI